MRLILTIAAIAAVMTGLFISPAAAQNNAITVECKGKAFPWYGECWSRFEGPKFTKQLRAHGVDPHVFARNWPQLARVFRKPWPGPRPWSEEWLLDGVNDAWPDVAAWYRIGVCESGRNPPNWQHNSGTYQGALGFYHGTWDGWNDFGFPSEAYLATPGQQMYVADNLYSDYGLTGWGCRGAA